MNIEISPKEYGRQLNYYDGMLYCSMLDIKGKKDWRMPTLEEFKYVQENGSYNGKKFADGWYWTATEYDSDSAWVGLTYEGDKKLTMAREKTTKNRIRAIRDRG